MAILSFAVSVLCGGLAAAAVGLFVEVVRALLDERRRAAILRRTLRENIRVMLS